METDQVVAGFLSVNNLSQYIPTFLSHRIGVDCFGELSMDDFDEMGIRSIGHKLKLFKLIGSSNSSDNIQLTLPNSDPDLEARIANTEALISKLETEVNKLKQEQETKQRQSSIVSSLKSPISSPSKTMSYSFKAKFVDLERQTLAIFSPLEPFKRVTVDSESNVAEFMQKVSFKYKMNDKLQYTLVLAYANAEIEMEPHMSPVEQYRDLVNQGVYPTFIFRGGYF